jgi:hypothetical protein
MSLVTAGVVIAGLLAVRTPAHKKAELSREELGLPPKASDTP